MPIRVGATRTEHKSSSGTRCARDQTRVDDRDAGRRSARALAQPLIYRRHAGKEACNRNKLPHRHRFLTPRRCMRMVRPAFEGDGTPRSCFPNRRECRSMADDARERDDGGRPPDDEAALAARLRHLGDRLRHVPPDAASGQSHIARPAADASAMARGFRLSSELVAGVLVGAAIGWALDHWLGISPWGMIVFLLLGFVAGVLNVMRAAGVLPAKTLDPPR